MTARLEFDGSIRGVRLRADHGDAEYHERAVAGPGKRMVSPGSGLGVLVRVAGLPRYRAVIETGSSSVAAFGSQMAKSLRELHLPLLREDC
jgi:hypothetical protein